MYCFFPFFLSFYALFSSFIFSVSAIIMDIFPSLRDGMVERQGGGNSRTTGLTSGMANETEPRALPCPALFALAAADRCC